MSFVLSQLFQRAKRGTSALIYIFNNDFASQKKKKIEMHPCWVGYLDTNLQYPKIVRFLQVLRYKFKTSLVLARSIVARAARNRKNVGKSRPIKHDDVDVELVRSGVRLEHNRHDNESLVVSDIVVMVSERTCSDKIFYAYHWLHSWGPVDQHGETAVA